MAWSEAQPDLLQALTLNYQAGSAFLNHINMLPLPILKSACRKTCSLATAVISTHRVEAVREWDEHEPVCALVCIKALPEDDEGNLAAAVVLHAPEGSPISQVLQLGSYDKHQHAAGKPRNLHLAVVGSAATPGRIWNSMLQVQERCATGKQLPHILLRALPAEPSNFLPHRWPPAPGHSSSGDTSSDSSSDSSTDSNDDIGSIEEAPQLRSMNASQREAVQQVLAERAAGRQGRILLIQGPPGVLPCQSYLANFKVVNFLSPSFCNHG